MTDQQTNLPDEIEEIEETEQTYEESAEETPASDDVFDGKFDPNTLDPALVPVYKGMQAHFTRKTQELAAKMKTLEESASKLEFVNQIETLQETDPKLAAQVLMLMAKQYDPGIAEPASASDNNMPQISWEEESPGVQYLARLLGSLYPHIQSAVSQSQAVAGYIANQRMQSELEALKAEIGEFDTEKVLAEVKHYPSGTPIRAIALATLFPQIKEQILSQAYANQDHKGAAGAIKPGNAQSTPDIKQPKTLAEAWALAKRGVKL